RMIQQHITSWYIHFKFYNSSTSSGNQGCLNIFIDQITTFHMNSIENLTNHMERRYQIRTSISDIQSNGLTSFSSDRIFTNHRSEEHTSELQSRENLVCRLLLEKKKE